MKIRNKILHIFLALLVAFLAVTATAPMPKAANDSGYCGETVYWYFDDSTGVLRIDGNGEMYRDISESEFNVYGDSIEIIIIGPDVETLDGLDFSKYSDLENIDVDASNRSFSSEDGVLYNYDKTVLIGYPSRKTDKSFVIPSGVRKIENDAFYYAEHLICLTLPDTVEEIGSYSLNMYSESINTTRGVQIPLSVKKIEHDAFGYGSTKTIYYESSQVHWDDIIITKESALRETKAELNLSGISEIKYNTDMPIKELIDESEGIDKDEKIFLYVAVNLFVALVLFIIGVAIVKNYKNKNTTSV